MMWGKGCIHVLEVGKFNGERTNRDRGFFLIGLAAEGIIWHSLETF